VQDKKSRRTYCLQRLSVSCILYLHEVHSSRSTTFLVVFAYRWNEFSAQIGVSRATLTGTLEMYSA
jgi:hypothetical protein